MAGFDSGSVDGCTFSKVAIGSIVAPWLWEERIMDECGVFCIIMSVSGGPVLVSAKELLMAEVLSGICPSGAWVVADRGGGA